MAGCHGRSPNLNLVMMIFMHEVVDQLDPVHDCFSHHPLVNVIIKCLEPAGWTPLLAAYQAHLDAGTIT
jgi:hypothetical protein